MPYTTQPIRFLHDDRGRCIGLSSPNKERAMMRQARRIGQSGASRKGIARKIASMLGLATIKS